MSKHDYKGWAIELVPQSEGNMWWCRYVIAKTGESTMQGAAIDFYSSCFDAEAAALKNAQKLIDAYSKSTMLSG